MQENRPKRILILMLVPMLATFIGQRLFLHLVPIKHLMVAGYRVHHSYLGLLFEIRLGDIPNDIRKLLK
jgi:hypothetical protein